MQECRHAPRSRLFPPFLILTALLIGLFSIADSIVFPETATATVRVRISWDNYQAPGSANTGNVTAGVIAKFKKIYSRFMPPNGTGIELVTSNNNLSINVVLSVNTHLNSPDSWGNAIKIGNSSAYIFGGTINSVASSMQITNESSLVNVIGHTLAHEFGHTQGLMHNNQTSTLMVRGSRLGSSSRFRSTQADRLTTRDIGILNTTLRIPGSASPTGGVRDGLRVIRGIEHVGFHEDWGIDFHAEFPAPPWYSLGYLSALGEFIPVGVGGEMPFGAMTFFPGDIFVPAIRHEETGEVVTPDPGGYLFAGDILPPLMALDPIPLDLYTNIIFAHFPPIPPDPPLQVVVDANFVIDIVTGDWVPQPYGNGFEIWHAGTAVDPDRNSAPLRLMLEQNRPNPFNPSTTIGFNIPQSGHVTLRIYDVGGRAVRTLIDANLTGNYHTVEWDGNDDGGQRVGSGVYAYRLEAGGKTVSRKMVITK